MTKIEKMVMALERWKDLYYNGSPEISDEEFDFEESKLKEMDPNNAYFYKVGSSSNGETKIVHKEPMLSMDKVQTAQQAQIWINKMGPVWIEPKLDGASGDIVYDKNGNFSYATTRGDGKVGSLIPFADKIKTIPKHFLKNSGLRGEFMILKKDRKQFDGPLRNCASGLLNRKTWTEECEYLVFIIYNSYSFDNSNDIPFKNRKDYLDNLNKVLRDCGNENFIMIEGIKGPITDVGSVYDDYVYNLRDKWPYETDGLIMTVDGDKELYDKIDSNYKISHHHRYNIALKPPAEFAKSVVKDIEINVNRIKLSFVAIVEPTIINGANVSRATLDNYENMRIHKIGIGSTVLLKRTNDIIPKIVESYNETGRKIKLINPEVCPICGEKLTLGNKDLSCTNEYGCKGIYASKIEFILKSLGVKNIGPSQIVQFVNYCEQTGRSYTFVTLFDLLLKPSRDLLSTLFNDPDSKKAIRFEEAGKSILNNITELKLIGSFNIPSVGEKMLVENGILTVKDFEKYVKELKDSNIQTTAFDYVLTRWSDNPQHMADLRACYNRLKPYFKATKTTEGALTYCISGEFSGMKKKDIIAEIDKLNVNLVFVPSVNMGTNLLVSNETNTGKVLKAKKYHIPILTYDEMISKFSK